MGLRCCLCAVVFTLLCLRCCVCAVVFVLLCLLCCVCAVVLMLLCLRCCACAVVFVLLRLCCWVCAVGCLCCCVCAVGCLCCCVCAVEFTLLCPEFCPPTTHAVVFSIVAFLFMLVSMLWSDFGYISCFLLLYIHFSHHSFLNFLRHGLFLDIFTS